ncbi:MAG TPA: PepSY-associated TM helix domain-containing protein [Methylotenera sp.]|nr:PepSY-associated TM helix domain-containing protein [Methylotenera sp.]
MTRRFWLYFHRYVGLATALFLILVGLTGSLLTFLPELNRVTAPKLFPEARPASMLSMADLIEHAERLVPQASINGVYLGQPGTASLYFMPKIDPQTGKPFDIGFDSLFLDPYTGEKLGQRRWGDVSEGWPNIMPFIYKLHYNLAIGEIGRWILGIIAVCWVLDCFVSFYLTFPATKKIKVKKTHLKRSFLTRWKPAWLIKWKASTFRLNFDIHRAGGLWLWVLLLIFAWSSVFMNLHDEVYAPITRLVFDYPLRLGEGKKLDKPLENPAINWSEAHKIADTLMLQQAKENHFTVEFPVNFWINRAQGTYQYVVHSSLDFQDKRGRTIVIFDANNGKFKQLLLPSGQHNGSTVTNWLQTLHEANVFGLPYRIFVCFLGIAIATLSVTGVYIWLKKRNARYLSEKLILSKKLS